MQDIYQYLLTKCKTVESLEYNVELERYDIHLESDNFITIIAGIHKLPGFNSDTQSWVDEIFYLCSFPRDRNKKRKFNLNMNWARDELHRYYLSYKLGEEGERDSKEISSPVLTIPQHQVDLIESSAISDVPVSF